MSLLAQVVVALTLVGSPAPSPGPSHVPAPSAGDGTIILFLVDNSASLPPLDPEEKRVPALEKMLAFVEGQPHRLVLFGGRREISVDDPTRYKSDGQWTDFYAAFEKAKEVVDSYPKGTEFKLVLLTDAKMDPDPQDFVNGPTGEALKRYASTRTLNLVREMKVPLYVVLVGETPRQGVVLGDPERTPGFVLDLVQAANGAKAAPLAQTLSGFFKDDGLLLKKFIFRVEPEEGLKKIAPVVRRIAAPPRPGVDLRFFGVLVVPLCVFLALLLGILVRSFPGPGDVEILELTRDAHVHVAVDRPHRVPSGGWSTMGLSMVADAKDAAATLTYEAPPLDHSGAGLAMEGVDPLTARLLPLGIDDLGRAIEDYAQNGSKEEKIYALNLDYMAKNFAPGEAEHILSALPFERSRLAPLDFLRAKAHLISNAELRGRLVEPRVHFVSYGKHAERKDLHVGSVTRLGQYVFLVEDLVRGGRKDARILLAYHHVPSFLGLKTLTPRFLQRVIRFRRHSERVVA
jgi:hypothetical protein